MSAHAPARAVLVTGAGKRLGRAIALRFAREGWDIAAHYHGSAEAAQTLCTEVEAMGGACLPIRADLSDTTACGPLVDAARAAFPRLTGLVNSASVFANDALPTMTPAFYRGQMAVNAEAPLLLTQAFHASLAGRGWVLNMIDSKMRQLTPDFFSYTLSKMALENVTRLCALACAPKLRVNAIAPGLVLRSGNQSEETFQRAHDRTPLRTGPTADEIAHWAVALAEAPSTTGQIVTVDGGLHFYTPSKIAERLAVPEPPEETGP